MSIPEFEAPGIKEIQRLLPAYEILELINKSGMSAVYRGRQIALDREVAIKILSREFGEDAEVRRSFDTEAKVMAKLSHPNLVKAYDFGEVDDMPYIVMEYVNGNALHCSTQGRAIEQIEATKLTLAICEGLAHAHEADVIHRDIKPGNMLLDTGKHPKIGGFGLSGVVRSDTPGYSAPETLNRTDEIDKRSNVYSIGLMLYELLTGELPGSPLVPASQKSAVDRRFDSIVDRAIHPSPDERFTDAGAMAGEVRDLLGKLSEPQRPVLMMGNATAKPRLVARKNPPVQNQLVSAPCSHGALVRNLVIIVVLLCAIFGANKTLQRKIVARDSQKPEQVIFETPNLNPLEDPTLDRSRIGATDAPESVENNEFGYTNRDNNPKITGREGSSKVLHASSGNE